MKFSEDFVCKKRPGMGLLVFTPYLSLIFAQKTDRGFDDQPLVSCPRYYGGQQSHACMFDDGSDGTLPNLIDIFED